MTASEAVQVKPCLFDDETGELPACVTMDTIALLKARCDQCGSIVDVPINGAGLIDDTQPIVGCPNCSARYRAYLRVQRC